MIRRHFKSWILVIMVTLFAFSASYTAKAADDAGVAGVILSPPLTEKEVTPGNSYEGKIKITNPNSNIDLKVVISLNDFKANGENGEQTFMEPEADATFSLASWITIEKEVVLVANETKEIPYSVKIPANAEPGGHYGVVFFTPSAIEKSSINGSGVLAVPKIGSLLLFTVPGNITYSGSIKEFTISKNFFTESKSNVDFVTRFENSSSNHVKPQGTITIKNLLGQEVASIQVNEKMGNVLPDSVRKFDNTWEYKYKFGLYTANINLAFGDNGTANAELSFWIVPWKETAGAIVLLILIIWILRHLRWGGKTEKVQPVNQSPLNQQPQAPVAPSSDVQQQVEIPAASVSPVPPTPTLSQTPPSTTPAQAPEQPIDQNINQ